MKKLLSIAFSIAVFSISWLQAQPLPEVSGIYQGLILGVDSAQGVVTGYYQEIFEPPNLPHLHCSFYLVGKRQGGKYAVQAWSPLDKKPKGTAGELSFFLAENNQPSVLLRLEKLHRDCVALKPNITKGQGAFFDIKKSGAWTEVRMVANPKSPYYPAPDPSSPTRDSAKRGTVLTVVKRQSDWVQVQSEQKPKGWIREADLYRTAPPGESAEPAPPVADKLTVPPAKVLAAPVVPAKQADISVPPTTSSVSELESKDEIIARLKVLNAQAFEMALQVLKNPSKRNALSAKRIEMEKDFNTLVTRLNHVAPSAYTEESKEIFEAYLDLQYVEQAQPVVSLRLNKIIQGLGK